jgi:hypothetical protein
MSQAELTALERDVEQARSRLAKDLARLRSPATFSAFKDELMERKDEIVDQARESARGTAQRVLDDLKDKAVANPAAALAIGAGLAWRLVRHPPIASLLVGVGVVSLLRTTTSPSRSKQPYMGLYDEDAGAGSNDRGIAARASELAGSLKERVQDWSSDAGETARDTVAQLTDKAAAMAGRASEAAHDRMAQLTDKAAAMTDRASEAARETATQISHKAADMADRASTALHDAMPEREARDKLLLGTAALAVAAAVGIAYQRRNQEERQLERVD